MQEIHMLYTQGMLMNEEERGNLSKQARLDFNHGTTRSYTAKTGILPREAEEGRQRTPLRFE